MQRGRAPRRSVPKDRRTTTMELAMSYDMPMSIRLALGLFFCASLLGCSRRPKHDGQEGATASEVKHEPSFARSNFAEPSLPGVRLGDTELDRALREALVTMPVGYAPRTKHLTSEGGPKFTNRLILESSPYLLQHAHNPVNWRAWSDEAFAVAKAQKKPVLLSIGYATCHWCHVMERESFEDEEIAAFINEHYVAIKVDREERPDIDALYMKAVQAFTGRGGWPMTVAMSDAHEPFFAGTYFPPRDGVRGVRQGLLTILKKLQSEYAQGSKQLAQNAKRLTQAIIRDSAPKVAGDVPAISLLATQAERLMLRFDPSYGGFGRAPKFPQPSQLDMLLRHVRRNGYEQSRAALQKTLSAMASGGIYDHVGGGFHRYATDAKWLVPHFEKMLYDNAQLASLYFDAYTFFRGCGTTRGCRRYSSVPASRYAGA